MELIVRSRGEARPVRIEGREDGYQITVGGRTLQVEVAQAGSTGKSLLIAGRQYEVSVNEVADGEFRVTTATGTEQVEVLPPLTHLARESRGGSGQAGRQQVTAYMPGRVVAILSEEGSTVEAGAGIVVLEAMKMENEIQAERAGVVSQILVEVGQAVEGGDPLFVIE